MTPTKLFSASDEYSLVMKCITIKETWNTENRVQNRCFSTIVEAIIEITLHLSCKDNDSEEHRHIGDVYEFPNSWLVYAQLTTHTTINWSKISFSWCFKPTFQTKHNCLLQVLFELYQNEIWLTYIYSVYKCMFNAE